jgi:hypothetical protein
VTATVSLISDPLTFTTALFIDGYTSTIEGNNIMHQLANGDTAPAFRNSSLRKGRLTLFYGTDDEGSREAEEMFAAGDYFELEDTDRPSIDMAAFVVEGRITRELDSTSRDHWTVTVEFEEVVSP